MGPSTAASLYWSAFESCKYFNVMLQNTYSHNKRCKNCEESRWWSLSAIAWPLLMSLMVRWQNLIGSLMHQLIVPLTLLAPARNIQTYKATKAQRYIRSNHWWHLSYFENNSTTQWNRIKLLLLIKLWLHCSLYVFIRQKWRKPCKRLTAKRQPAGTEFSLSL